MTPAIDRSSVPDLSIVMPCYNEDEVLPYTVPQLLDAFEEAGIHLELVAVDNGSTDNTSGVIQGFVDQGRSVVHHRVEVNEGYGNGILQGLAHCSAPWVGSIPADGQVDAEDVVKLFDAIRHSHDWVLGKVRRRFRMDGLWRKVVSIAYNGMINVLWPGLGSIDVNGSPKIMPREVAERMELESRHWFLDPEIMIKAHYMGVRVLEMNVFARMRGNGLSHVRATTCVEFIKNLLAHRFSRRWRRWKAEHRREARCGAARSGGS